MRTPGNPETIKINLNVTVVQVVINNNVDFILLQNEIIIKILLLKTIS